MTKKIKQQEKTYIVINSNNDEIITIDTKENVVTAIEEYFYDMGWDKSDIEDTITIFELGKEVKFDIDVDIKITF